MERTVNLYLQGMEFSEPQAHEDMVLFPVRSNLNPGPDYITMSEALELGILEVSEVSAGGSVPELRATNKGQQPILLLDGEELKGAMQNRVLNTTIMIAPGTTVIIPVSCVEAHRWHSHTLRMESSNHVMNYMSRLKKIEQVNRNLEADRSFFADQHEIWADIDLMARKLNVQSPTSAMSDIYEARAKDLEDYLKAFYLVPGQKGWLVFIGGKPVGLEFISREAAFGRLFQKLLKSYVLEAVSLKYDELKRTKRQKKNAGVEKQSQNKKITGSIPSLERAQAFLKEAASCQEKRYPSIGMGYSCCYLGNRIVGASLEVDSSIIHLVFFAMDDGKRNKNDQNENFPRLHLRRSYLFKME
ncbi:MAG: ARPP-1 family domain-containing protein [Candidatus Saccharicenans sp.]|uniref:ARPP-1 family domain-containing protein n=1 Tax=Candidatus Saccharicenans sp. TaxID=2819258 RepID=UPI00404B3292